MLIEKLFCCLNTTTTSDILLLRIARAAIQ
jgi:hypothetical protein